MISYIVMNFIRLYDTVVYYFSICDYIIFRFDSILSGSIYNMSFYSKGCPSIVRVFPSIGYVYT